jgi:hypothetical protein
MTAEEFMENFIISLDDSIYEMLIYVEDGRFEDAAISRDLIENMIVKAKKVIIRKMWTKLGEDDLEFFLRDIRDNMIMIWEVNIITNKDARMFSTIEE